jgi:hypothetical protein
VLPDRFCNILAAVFLFGEYHFQFRCLDVAVGRIMGIYIAHSSKVLFFLIARFTKSEEFSCSTIKLPPPGKYLSLPWV